MNKSMTTTENDWVTLASVSGVGTEYEMQLNETATLLRVTVASGPVYREIERAMLSDNAVLNMQIQRTMVLRMVNNAMDEVAHETGVYLTEKHGECLRGRS